MIRLIIAGGRDFKRPTMAMDIIDRHVKRLGKKVDELVNGDCPTGIDHFARYWAKCNAINITRFPPEWSKDGLGAGPKRNKLMAEYATHCLCIWDGKSRGTKSMIEEAKKAKLILTVVDYNGKIIT